MRVREEQERAGDHQQLHDDGQHHAGDDRSLLGAAQGRADQVADDQCVAGAESAAGAEICHADHN